MNKEKQWLPITERLNIIVKELESAGMTKAQLCLRLGVQTSNIYQYLNGSLNPSRFAEAVEELGYSKDWYLYGIGNPRKSDDKHIITFSKREKEVIKLVDEFIHRFKKIMDLEK